MYAKHDVEEAYFTEGESVDSVTVPKPAARTATAWSSPSMNRMPRGRESMAGLPRSSTRKQNQSVQLLGLASKILTLFQQEKKQGRTLGTRGW